MTKKRKPVANLFFYIGLAIVMFIILFPMIWLVLCTFKPNEEIFSSELHILPINPTIDSYIYAFNDQNKLLLYLGNSLFTAALTAIITMFYRRLRHWQKKLLGHQRDYRILNDRPDVPRPCDHDSLVQNGQRHAYSEH